MYHFQIKNVLNEKKYTEQRNVIKDKKYKWNANKLPVKP